MQALDAARGLAILGMLAAHTITPGNVVLTQPETYSGIVNGNSAVLFAMLAGVSLGIMTGFTTPLTGERLARAKVRILVRAGLLLVLFTPLAALFNRGVVLILSSYAVWFALSLVFLSWRPQKLFIAAGVLAIVGPFLQIVIDSVSAALALRSVPDIGGLSLLISHDYPTLSFLAFVMLGLGIARSGPSRQVVQRRMLVAGIALALIGFGTGTALSLSIPQLATPQSDGGNKGISSSSKQSGADLDSVADQGSDELMPKNSDSLTPKDSGLSSSGSSFDGNGGSFLDRVTDADSWKKIPTNIARNAWKPLRYEPHTHGVFENLGAAGLALIITSLLLLASKVLRWVAPLSALGSMALTGYIAHVMMLTPAQQLLGNSELAFATITGVLLVFAVLWRGLLGRGPMEWLMWKISGEAARG